MLKLNLDKLNDLFAALAAQSSLYMPLDQAGQVLYGRWDESKTVRLDALNTVKSAKELYFPQSENLMAFKREGKKIEIHENRDDNEIFTVFGVRACDAAAIGVLDKVFLAPPADTYYQNRRNNGTMITLACAEPEESCFCTAFGIDPTHPAGDIRTWMADGFLWWEVLTEKGQELTDKLAGLLENADDTAALDEHIAAVNTVVEKLPYGKLDLSGWNGDVMMEKFNDPLWAELSQACIGCGTCTFVCPTCQCYDIRDYDTGHGIQRFRCWDSCMYSEFTRMAHGNNRLTQVERFRQRFMHKLVYFPANNDGAYSCVGCGRCLTKCPISMNIVKVIKAFNSKGGNENA